MKQHDMEELAYSRVKEQISYLSTMEIERFLEMAEASQDGTKLQQKIVKLYKTELRRRKVDGLDRDN